MVELSSLDRKPVDPASNPMIPYNPQYTVTQDYYNQGDENAVDIANMPA